MIPRRSSLAGDRGVLIVSYSMHKLKTMFFFLLQVRRLLQHFASLAPTPAHFFANHMRRLLLT